MNRINSNIKNNIQIRKDDFFAKDPILDRSAGDEILEGTLIAAKNEYEEKKLKYYGNLVANIAFHQEIDSYHANYLLRIAERLSYRQICILTLFNRKSNYNFSSNFSERYKTLYQNQNEFTLVLEIKELKILELLGSSNEALFGGGPAGNITPATTELRNIGKILHTIMNLDEIDRSEIDKLADILSDPV